MQSRDRRKRELRRFAWAALLLGASALARPTTAQELASVDLARLSIDELANLEITSVSLRPERLGEAASAIYVITAEDIRRSGVSSLPEVLRLAPNLQLQRLNTVDYAISARGFNGFETSNKLLVLIDGRSVYSLLHSGVFWDQQATPLEDIERIEVISGPGGTLFGANAVNGVINIITKSASATGGALVSAGVGDDDRTLTARYGGALGQVGSWRVYATGFERSALTLQSGADGGDGVSGVQAGFRTDFALGREAFTVQGDAYRNDAVEVDEVEGANLLGRWTHGFAGGSLLSVQGYYDRSIRRGVVDEEREDTFDIAVQQTFAPVGRHALVIGGGYRFIDSVFEPAPGAFAFLDPEQRDVTLLNVFAQDQIRLRDDLTLTVGLKVEDGSLSGVDYQPNVRLAWRRTPNDLLWGAVSQAVRTPSRIERDLTAADFLIGGFFESETVIAYEAGYRADPRPDLTFSVSAFYNVYEGLRTASFAPDGGFPLRFKNGAEGDTYGIEAWGKYDVTPTWRLSGGVTTFEGEFELSPGATDIAGLASAGDDPGYRVTLRSESELTDALELDVRLRAVDELLAVDSYVEADVRLGYRVTDGVELYLTGANLLDDERFENGDTRRRRVLGRSVYAGLRWRY